MTNVVFDNATNKVVPDSKEVMLEAMIPKGAQELVSLISTGTTELITLDSTAKTLTIPADTVIWQNNQRWAGRPREVVDLSVTASTAILVYFDTVTEAYVVRPWNDVLTVQERFRFLLFCTCRTSLNNLTSPSISVNAPSSVDGVNRYGVVNDKDSSALAIAHRGYSAVYPENTLIALAGGYKFGFRVFEVDISFSSDGVPYLMHDLTLGRTTGDPRNANGVTIAEVQALEAGTWKGARFAGEAVPTFAEAVAFCKKFDSYLHFEVKGIITQAQFDTIHTILKTQGMVKNTRMYGYNPENHTMAALTAPDLPLCYLRTILETWEINVANAFKTPTNDVVIGVSVVTQAMVDEIHDRGMKVYQYTLNQRQDIIGAINMGVDGVITDLINVRAVINHSITT